MCKTIKPIHRTYKVGDGQDLALWPSYLEEAQRFPWLSQHLSKKSFNQLAPTLSHWEGSEIS
jgi:hypothetical protein